MNPLDRYITEHGHPLRIWSGEYVAVYAANGYLIVRDLRGGRDLYLSRKQLLGLLPKALLALKKMDRSVDVEARMARMHAQEMEHLNALRVQKRERGASSSDVERQRKQRERFLRAKARAARRDA